MLLPRRLWPLLVAWRLALPPMCRLSAGVASCWALRAVETMAFAGRGTITAVALRTTRALRTRALLTHAHVFFNTCPETYTGARVVHRGDEL